MPLLVRVKVIYMPNIVENWLPTPFVYNDVFNAIKVEWIYNSALIAVPVLIAGWIAGKVNLKFRKSDFLIFAFILLGLLSSILSPHSEIVWKGYPERWHGYLTWLSYFVMYFYIRLVVIDHNDRRNVLRMILFSAFILSMIGLLQFMGQDPFKVEFIKKIILPAEYVKKYGVDALNFTFEKKRVYMTLYNPNNVGIYVAGLLPCCFAGLAIEEKKYMKFVWILVSILNVLALIGSYSRAGLIALGFAIVIYGSINLKVLKQKWTLILVALIAVVAIGIIGDNVSGKVLSSRLYSVFKTSPQYSKLEQIQIHGQQMEMQYNNKNIILSYETPPLCRVENELGKEFETIQEENGYYKFSESNLQGLTYGYGKSGKYGYYIVIQANRLSWQFVMAEDGFKYINNYGKLVDLQNPESIFFENMERFGSNRGYIWSRSLPLIKEYFILGSGPDTFTVRFPQRDYVTQGNTFGDTSTIVDKPHNQYIGFLIEFGFLGTALFLAWIVIKLFNNRNNILAISVVAIMVTYIFYDINVGTGWMLFAILSILEMNFDERGSI